MAQRRLEWGLCERQFKAFHLIDPRIAPINTLSETVSILSIFIQWWTRNLFHAVYNLSYLDSVVNFVLHIMAGTFHPPHSTEIGSIVAPSLKPKLFPQPLDGEVLLDSGWPAGSGGFAIIYRATWFHRGKETRVAVKVLKVHQLEDGNVQGGAEITRKRLWREISVWTRLEHRNILPFYGVIHHFGPVGTYGMVCPWIDNGDLSRYLTIHKGLSPIKRLNFVKQITDGLSYLHSNDVVHGDLTGKNVLIGDDGHVFICDFGLSSIWGDPDSAACQTTSTVKFNLRWTAPEIMISNLRPTVFTDVYSLASIMLQVFTGCMPYHGKTDGWVFLHIHSGNLHPPHPVDAGLIPVELWDLMLRCWAKVPEDRPSAITISRSLLSMSL